MVQEWIGIVSTKRTLMAPPAVKVAATDTNTAANGSDDSGENKNQRRNQQQTDCNICGSVHATEACASLAELTLDERLNKLYECHLCYHCLEKNHTAKFCKNRPSCGICGKRHNTVLHGRQLPQILTNHQEGEEMESLDVSRQSSIEYAEEKDTTSAEN